MKFIYLISVLLIISCADSERKPQDASSKDVVSGQKPKPSLIVLGTIQDAGSPHIACKKDCCKLLFQQPDKQRKVVSLGVVDPQYNKYFLFEATPDISEQLKILKNAGKSSKELPDGILLTHAHIGHYTGLMYLGKEATNASKVPVYVMPKMKQFLETNGPWGQLVSDENILLKGLEQKVPVKLTPNITIVPFRVPHRDEYSETVGYKIEGPDTSVLFIPDIDKWEKWDESIITAIASVDLAFIDASFYDAEEINNRDITQIPHPFVIESMQLFQNLSETEKSKVHFIHLNHTNPLINPQSPQTKAVLESGFKIARFQQLFKL
ncbi:MAG: MBL fold metallo-hydrolase [Flavobacteriaceae bacterium]